MQSMTNFAQSAQSSKRLDLTSGSFFWGRVRAARVQPSNVCTPFLVAGHIYDLMSAYRSRSTNVHILLPRFSCSLVYHRVPAPPHSCCLPGRANSMALCYLSQSYPFCSKVRSSRDSSTSTMVAHCFVEFLILSPQRKCQSSLTLHP